MNRFEIETSEKLGTPGIEEMSQAWGWKVPTLASTGIKLRPAAAAHLMLRQTGFRQRVGTGPA